MQKTITVEEAMAIAEEYSENNLRLLSDILAEFNFDKDKVVVKYRLTASSAKIIVYGYDNEMYRYYVRATLNLYDETIIA